METLLPARNAEPGRAEWPRVVATRRYGTASPLRYPGGKAALAGLFGDIIGRLGVKEARYVEPYAGGVGAGIALLQQGLVGELVINDIDPAVHAFWRAVIDHNEQFVEQVRTVPLSIPEWQRQRERRMDDTRSTLGLIATRLCGVSRRSGRYPSASP
jgi:DNA adenine methylase